jgi:cytoskeleton protein RodZ
MSAAELSAQSDSPELPSAGEQLAAVRQSRGLSVAEIAQQLKLSPWQVEALESGDYKRLPSPVFVRGFIRNYARLLKIDVADMLATSEHQLPAAAPLASAVRRASAEIPFPTERRRINWSKYAIATVILLIPLAVYEFYPDDTPEQAVKSGQVELAPPQVQVVAETASTPVPAVAVTPPSLTPVADEPRPERVQPGVTPPPEAAASAQRAAGEHVVKLHFVRESWVEIRDRSGRKIFSRLNAPGTDKVVSGLPPLSLIVGNANGVQLTHNEQPVNLGPHTKVNVARLTLE